jgi:hypothetical protein
MNKINERQNTTENIKKIAAQRQLYRNARKISLIQFIFIIPIAVLMSTVSVINQKFETYTALYGILITLVDILCINPKIDKLKLDAALIQELFDCNVLLLKWNEIKNKKKPDNSLIIFNFNKYKRKSDLSELKNWYTLAVSTTSLKIGRILAQFENCKWDSKLRKLYSILLTIVLIIFLSLIFLISIRNGFTTERFLMLFLSPSLS